jgi:hypothetical protein
MDGNLNQIRQNIVAFARGDVNGDKIPENVYLTGSKTVDSPFIQNITLIIQDGRTGKFTTATLKENTGYNPTLFLGDFTGDGVMDIMISIATGGSGGIMIYYIYSFLNNNLQILFNSADYNEKYKYEITYKDFYKVEVLSKINNQKFIIDISLREPSYLKQIYDENGKLKAPINGFVNPLSGLYPIDFDSNGVYELLTFQKVAGLYNADSLGYVQNELKWADNKFVLLNQFVAVLGSNM